MTWNVRKLISPPVQCTSITYRFLSFFWPFYPLITTVWVEVSENSYFRDFNAQISQIGFLAYLIVFTAYYPCMIWLSGNSYFQYFNAQVSRIEFLAYFTALTLITTVWVEISENSYLRHFNAEVSQIVFLAYLTVLRIITLVWPDCQETHISSISMHKYHESSS